MFSAKRFYWSTVALIVGGGIFSLFFYAHLMPLHVDESGYWFNFTNKTFSNRFVPNNQIPNHTLSIYMAKGSLSWFGNNGIGYRFPVILFGALDALLLFFLARRITGSAVVASLSSSLIMVLPWFLHYSHELRGYPPYLFFVLGCYYALYGLLTDGNRLKYWALWLISFLGCYYSNLGAIVFIFNLIAALWILKIGQMIKPENERLASLKAIPLKAFLLFSLAATALFLYIVLVPDSGLISQNHKYQLGEKVAPLLLAADIFSKFLGYVYVQDHTSILFHYPLPIFLVSLGCFLFGFWKALKENHFYSVFFVILYIVTIIFGFFFHVQGRAVIYLLPFVLVFQALGLIELSQIFVAKMRGVVNKENAVYGVLSCVLLIYFCLLSIGKYKNFEPKSGNPYELTRAYLQENIGPNDLILSNLYDTVGGFYLGDLMREKVSNIYNNGKIENIYYLTAKPTESKIRFQMAFPKSQSLELLPLDKFERVVSFENKGVRPSEVHIFKRKVDASPVVHLNAQALAIPEYFGNFNRTCKRRIDGEGLRISCENSQMACSNLQVTVNGVTENDFQFVLFHHQNDVGAKAISFASLKSMAQKQTLPKEQIFVPIPETYRVNPIFNNIQDLDIFRKNVDLMDIGLQKMGTGNQAILCMVGKLFKNNSLIKGVSAFNFTP